MSRTGERGYDLFMPPRDPSPQSTGRLTTPPRSRGEAAAAAKTAYDEAELRAERLRYEAEGPRTLLLGGALDALLDPGELVRAVEAEVVILGRPGDLPASGAPPIPGNLAVTSRRVLHLAPAPTIIALEDIEDAAVTRDRLLLILGGRQSLVLGTDRPRLLRFLISRARADRAAVLRAGRAPAPGQLPDR